MAYKRPRSRPDRGITFLESSTAANSGGAASIPTRQPTAAVPGTSVLSWLLFVSGAVALVYEVVWQRQFALVFGSGAPATAAVLSAYFAGLGAGSLLVGRWARRWSRPLRAYAALEFLVGLGALLVSPLLAGFESAYPWLYDALSGHPAWFVAAKIALAFLALALPTFCLGGTLPLLGPLVDRSQRQLGRTAGWLYVVNTAGAALGAAAVPFFLLPQLGLAQTVWTCAALNGALAAVAWLLDRGLPPAAPAPAARVGLRAAATVKNATARPPVGLLAGLSGVTTFAIQVLWNRAFAQVHENSLYSFAVIVAVVILALAIGAQLSRLALRRGVEPGRLFGGAWLLAGPAVAVGPWLFLRLSDGLGYLPAAGGWMAYGLQLALLATAVLALPMALLGIGLPALMELAGRSAAADTGRALGRLLAANIAGSVAGALIAGFLLPSWLGLWNSLLWVGALVFAAGWWQWQRWWEAAAQRYFGYILAAAWLASLLPVSRLELPRVRLDAARGEQLVALTEGVHGITAVVERPGSRRLKLNNHYGLGGTASTGDERMQAHVPLLLHPAPRRVAFLGLGTGISAGGALFHPVEEVTVMELVPDVVTAARIHFRGANRAVLDQPRTVVVIDDARNRLRGSRERFDVIIGDLVVPWRQGEGALFTLEQFTAARDALAPDGLFCQWLPLFQLSETEVNILARTFLTVFPRAQLWRGDFSPTEPALALIGTTGDWRLDTAHVETRLAEMQPDPTNPQLRLPGAFWMNLVGVLESSDLPANETRLNGEDRPWIELLGPMQHSGGNNDALFTGRRLQAWLEQVQLRSRERLAYLPKSTATAVAAGGVLGNLTLCLSEGDQAGAFAAQEQLRQMLPAETFRQLFP